MKQIVTSGIILHRIDYGEADRILTILTPDQGKIRVMAKGVRKVKSKLAGGIELFSVSQITFIPGRKDISTLVSTRLKTHYPAIVQDLDRTMLGYELLKRINKATEDEPGDEYFDLLVHAFEALQDGIDLPLIETWFDARLLTLAGHQPNVASAETSSDGYIFDYESMSFVDHPSGVYNARHIKLLRLIFASAKPAVLTKVADYEQYIGELQLLLRNLRSQSIGS